MREKISLSEFCSGVPVKQMRREVDRSQAARAWIVRASLMMLENSSGKRFARSENA
jgi:hypothetical protein